MKSSRGLVLPLLVALLCGLATLWCGAAEIPRHHSSSVELATNPFAADPRAVAAGRKLFLDHCAQCHGKNADGTSHGPSLQSGEIQGAPDGELEWFLRNGNLVRGMPSWSKLPDQQRWQLVRYLKSLDPQ